VDFGVGFRSISEVDYFFTFGSDPLDPGECLDFANTDFPTGFGGGFCNGGTTPQPSRLLTICVQPPSATLPRRHQCRGNHRKHVSRGSVSVRITSLTVTVVAKSQFSRDTALSGLVAALVARGGLSEGNGNALQAKLRAAAEQFDRGNRLPPGIN